MFEGKYINIEKNVKVVHVSADTPIAVKVSKYGTEIMFEKEQDASCVFVPHIKGSEKPVVYKHTDIDSIKFINIDEFSWLEAMEESVKQKIEMEGVELVCGQTNSVRALRDYEEEV